MKKLRCVFMSLLLVAAILVSGISLPVYASEKPWVLLGDVNQDGFITLVDARLALRQAGRLDKPFEDKSLNYYATDADEDGKITVLDARIILRSALGIEAIHWQTPDPNAVDGLTTQDILDRIRNYGNMVKEGQKDFRRKEVAEIHSFDAKFVREFLVPGFIKSMLLEELENSSIVGTKTYGPYFTSGTRAKEVFPSEGKDVSIESDFNAGMIKSATAVRNNNQQIYTIMLNNEKFSGINKKPPDTVIKTNHGKIFADVNIRDMVNQLGTKDLTIKDITFTFRDSYVRYVFEGDELVSAEYHLRWTVSMLTSVTGLLSDVRIEILSSTTQTFYDFVDREAA